MSNILMDNRDACIKLVHDIIENRFSSYPKQKEIDRYMDLFYITSDLPLLEYKLFILYFVMNMDRVLVQEKLNISRHTFYKEFKEMSKHIMKEFEELGYVIEFDENSELKIYRNNKPICK